MEPSEETARTAGTPAAPPVGWLPRSAAELFGEGATAEEAYGLLTVDVPADSWTTALETARDTLGCTYFDWLSAVDEPGQGFRVAAYVVALAGPAGPGPAVRTLLVRTTVPHDAPTLPTATGVYAGAVWHERETHEMFGIGFTGHPHLAPLLLPDGFEGHPLRKDFVLAARVAKAWPGAKEPGESDHGGPKRRQMLPPGVPDPNEWGPLKGQLPPAPARPARGARAAGGAAGERPARGTRTASAGSAGRQTAAAAAEPTAKTPAGTAERPVRRTRTASGGSASQRETAAPDAAAPDAAAPAERPARRVRSAGGGSASRRAETPETPAADAAAPAAPEQPARRTRSSDAPWHHARPAHDDEAPGDKAAPAEAAPDTAEAAPDRATSGKPEAEEQPRPSGEDHRADENTTDDQPGGTG
ncbi:NADH-quinone oxidoreductase subunit C [Streptomyces sp. NA02950]|uniref:NADH-quinone oxidoreductase subunit C n=1 Tax=Streptomyces sp. NA02950 TaxID=2742137 RepID=UPI00158FA275|nr:NADH-quinone oxidoreductase subunit C [Streptomyces sp. NA02950]QKV97662.1 NADH-quinone oxidoreductase subunit C [Streptomyces sp. NA02950]